MRLILLTLQEHVAMTALSIRRNVLAHERKKMRQLLAEMRISVPPLLKVGVATRFDIFVQLGAQIAETQPRKVVDHDLVVVFPPKVGKIFSIVLVPSVKDLGKRFRRAVVKNIDE